MPLVMVGDGVTPIQVDAGVALLLAEYRWFIDSRGYVRSTVRDRDGKTSAVMMHRLLTYATKGVVVDHINGDLLDNRRENLRVCTPAENSRNRKKHRKQDRTGIPQSGFKGVQWDEFRDKPRPAPWRARIVFGGKAKCLGRFRSPIEAARAYDREAVRLHGDFARLNFPQAA